MTIFESVNNVKGEVGKMATKVMRKSGTEGMGSIDALRNMSLDTKVIVEYIWIDGFNKLRAKSRTVDASPSKASDLPEWNYDGSSTGQAPGNTSEVILKPQRIFPDPFRGQPHILVMCDTYTPQGDPLKSNMRYECNEVMKKAKAEEPWFGLEQEYFIMNPRTGKPIGFPDQGDPAPQGFYYCGVSGSKMYGREIADAHYKACIYSGIIVSGINAEVAPGQWEFQVGPAVGIEQGDMMWMARYLLERIAEMAGLDISYDPKPVKGNWNGTGCHANFSTKGMREPGGYEKYIKPSMEKLALNHKEHIEAYGEGNHERLTGSHETASIDQFTWGVGNRGASCRVGNDVALKGYGYFEDRRPAGNVDPYVVTKMLVKTCCL